MAHYEQGPPSILYDFNDRFPFLRHPGMDVLVGCERFVTPPGATKRSAQPVAQQVVGVVEQIAVINGWKLRLQAPADAKALINDALLQLLRLWRVGRDVGCRDANDVNDASRHALTLLAQFRASMFATLLGDTTV
jgi:hypothetical protein